MNLLLAPTAVRYDRADPLPIDRFVLLEGCVREEARYDIPPLPVNDGPLVYLSFGSSGAIDTDLISRMMETFARLPARFFVNVGDFPESYRSVPDNVYLGSWFPQPSIVAQADLFIHHGGNNSFCEALYFGVPSLIMPYCWDGHDNAARASQTGTGKHMGRAEWTHSELGDAVMALISDRAMLQRLQHISLEMATKPGTVEAAKQILFVSSPI